uniref:Uncharacterized protein n=1 Tax=Micrurus spixii TaxID=129469 RepID=A0A2D4MSM7_9SAUR
MPPHISWVRQLRAANHAHNNTIFKCYHIPKETNIYASNSVKLIFIHRIIELEGPWRYLNPIACSGRRPYTSSDKWLPSLFLKASGDGSPTTFEGKLFHC